MWFVLWEPQSVQGHVSCWDLHQPGHPCRSSFTLRSVGNSSGARRWLWALGRRQNTQVCDLQWFLSNRTRGNGFNLTLKRFR